MVLFFFFLFTRLKLYFLVLSARDHLTRGLFTQRESHRLNLKFDSFFSLAIESRTQIANFLRFESLLNCIELYCFLRTPSKTIVFENWLKINSLKIIGNIFHKLSPNLFKNIGMWNWTPWTLFKLLQKQLFVKINQR